MNKQSELYIGLMSGTSMDSIDAVLIEFCENEFNVLDTCAHPVDEMLRSQMLAISSQTPLKQIAILDTAIAEAFAQAAINLINQAGVDAKRICAIGSHGQTVAHYPNPPACNSIQLGNPAHICQRTNITVVSDFRRRDIAANGQGAPLVPAFHNAYMRSSDENRCILNIGGIANISILPADSSKIVTGFDTGPGNTLMDSWIRLHQNKSYDDKGQWAEKGTINPSLLELLLSDPFFSAPPPKSTGKEHFNLSWVSDYLDLIKDPVKPEDIQASLSELTAQSIVNALFKYAPQTDRLLICGGGVRNTHLLNRIKSLAEKLSIGSTSEIGVDPQWVEASAFAWLARQTLNNLTGNLPSVTGASKEVVLGAIYPA